MLRKRKVQDAAPTSVVTPAVPAVAPVNVIVVVESRRRRKTAGHKTAGNDGRGHPVAKGLAGVAIAKRLTRRRKRPLRARVRKAVKRGRKRVRKAARRVRRALV